ncbi:hypothetical protein CPB84DRAFT_1850910 [Gymnopilus junonius]|uniref:Uncharacterized protein n=1 Tax=Gymnopilus junonius TaxID=109634 RepID=A0A9P5NGA0_GYMJU|nr:hypothetical protein CPB84DRAFT_1850910 [Gymnopilus junonius]
MIHQPASLRILLLTLIVAIFWNSFASAAPLAPHRQCARLSKRTGYTLLGWKGLRAGLDAKAYERHPTTSGGGELGDVLYIADGTDLARSFAHTHICEIYADTTEWHHMPKAWVSQAQIHQRVGPHTFPGAALFASHTAAGVHGDASPWQLGIRGSDIGRIGLVAKCYPLNNPCTAPGLKIHYDQLSASWSIHGKPDRGH